MNKNYWMMAVSGVALLQGSAHAQPAPTGASSMPVHTSAGTHVPRPTNAQALTVR